MKILSSKDKRAQRQRICRLKARHFTYREIGEKLGLPASRVSQILIGSRRPPAGPGKLNPLNKFALDFIHSLRDRGLDFFDDEASEEICPMLVEAGLMTRERYDPQGKHAVIDCEADAGCMIWIWNAAALEKLRQNENPLP